MHTIGLWKEEEFLLYLRPARLSSFLDPLRWMARGVRQDALPAGFFISPWHSAPSSGGCMMRLCQGTLPPLPLLPPACLQPTPCAHADDFAVAAPSFRTLKLPITPAARIIQLPHGFIHHRRREVCTFSHAQAQAVDPCASKKRRIWPLHNKRCCHCVHAFLIGSACKDLVLLVCSRLQCGFAASAYRGLLKDLCCTRVGLCVTPN